MVFIRMEKKAKCLCTRLYISHLSIHAQIKKRDKITIRIFRMGWDRKCRWIYKFHHTTKYMINMFMLNRDSTRSRWNLIYWRVIILVLLVSFVPCPHSIRFLLWVYQYVSMYHVSCINHTVFNYLFPLINNSVCGVWCVYFLFAFYLVFHV